MFSRYRTVIPGTNMTMTIMAAAKEVAALEDPTMESTQKAISSGSLRGARGNSGVILSQLFRGFTKGIKSMRRLMLRILAAAFQKAVETAYKAVRKPKEGTILRQWQRVQQTKHWSLQRMIFRWMIS